MTLTDTSSPHLGFKAAYQNPTFSYMYNRYLTLQLLDSLLERGNGIFVHGGVYVPLGRISACKKHFSFWILIETNHLSTCQMCLGRERECGVLRND